MHPCVQAALRDEVERMRRNGVAAEVSGAWAAESINVNQYQSI